MTIEEPSSTPVPATPDFDAHVVGVSALSEPVRRVLYAYVVAQPAPVNRDEVALGAGVARHVAKFHLDKLVEDGLLDVEYARPPGRTGPGAGRTAKYYRRSQREFTVSLPPREYELAGRLLARAVATSERDQTAVGDSLREGAREVGRALGRRARRQAGARPGHAALLTAMTAALRDHGYEPRAVGTGITLANCPFHALAQDYTDLVCGMNLELMTGLVDGLAGIRLEARLEPAPGQCCVRLARVEGAPGTDGRSTKEAR